ncbi:IS4 family transposase [Mucilaginibacter dorajii]|nr:IS4 family transposase [Mucilaginibacter dorajii]
MRETLLGEELIAKFKMEKQDFTRNRKQPFLSALLLMINQLRKSLAIEIDGFVRYFNGRFSAGISHFTSSAFIQNRKKINPDVFKHLTDVIIKNFYTKDNDELKLLQGFRILACDSSAITLPFTKEFKERYGVVKNVNTLDVAQAKISVLYDVLNELVLDIDLDKSRFCERSLALRHRSYWQTNDLIIYDRGYPSFGFINEHVQAGIDYLMRVKKGHSELIKTFVDSGKKSEITLMRPDQDKSFKGKPYTRKHTIPVRLIRVELPGNEIEILITSLLDSRKYPAKMFMKLYFMRWGVETFYDELKNKLKVEYFSGYSDTSVRQDLFCAVFISNLQSVIVNGLDDELEVINEKRKLNYKVNTNVSYGLLKNRIIDLLCQKAPLDDIYQELEGLFLKHTIPIRGGTH